LEALCLLDSWLCWARDASAIQRARKIRMRARYGPR
jgi:hypothetical protein